jgi:hypothetical protein
MRCGDALCVVTYLLDRQFHLFHFALDESDFVFEAVVFDDLTGLSDDTGALDLWVNTQPTTQHTPP